MPGRLLHRLSTPTPASTLADFPPLSPTPTIEAEITQIQYSPTPLANEQTATISPTPSATRTPDLSATAHAALDTHAHDYPHAYHTTCRCADQLTGTYVQGGLATETDRQYSHSSPRVITTSSCGSSLSCREASRACCIVKCRGSSAIPSTGYTLTSISSLS